MALIKKWDIEQLYVQNAFLHGDLKESVYMTQPRDFEDPEKPEYVWKLKKSIYGLKQAPRAWFYKFSDFLLDFFQRSFPDQSIFIYHHGSDFIYLVLYIDDMLLTGNNSMLFEKLLISLSTVF